MTLRLIIYYVHVFNDVGINLSILVVDLSTGEVGPAKPMRAEIGWTVGELKQYIGEVRKDILSGRIYCHLHVYCSFLSSLTWSLGIQNQFIMYEISKGEGGLLWCYFSS